MAGAKTHDYHILPPSINPLIGAFSGYMGGYWDNFFMGLMDILLAFPSLILAIAIVTVLGPGLINTMFAIGIVNIPIYARISSPMAAGCSCLVCSALPTHSLLGGRMSSRKPMPEIIPRWCRCICATA